MSTTAAHKPPKRQANRRQPPEPPRLPADSEAELWTIGAAMIEPRIVPELLTIAKPSDFLDPHARQTFAAIQRLHDRGEPIDHKLIRVEASQGRDASQTRDLHLYWASVIEDIPTAAGWRHHAQRVAAAAKRRQLLRTAERVRDRAIAGDSPEEMAVETLEEVAKMIEKQPDGADLWTKWHGSLADTDRRMEFDHAPSNNQLRRIKIGPGQVTLLGGKPGAGKTALAMQMAINAMVGDESLRVLVCNCEMDPSTLLDRQLARAARVPYGVVRDRTYAGDRRQKIYTAGELMLSLRDRLAFMGPPFTMQRVRALAASHRADIVHVDYVQRFKAGDNAVDQRLQVSEAMSACREIAMAGPAVLAVSALSRTGEFRESSELEYGADTAFVIEKDEDDRRDVGSGSVPLVARCLKKRHGELRDVELTFTGRFQEHTAPAEKEEWDFGQ